MRSDHGIEIRPAHLRALLAVAEARHLTFHLARANGPAFLWPGFDFSRTPLVVYREHGEAFLVQHPDPPTGLTVVDLPIPGLDTPVHFSDRSFPGLPAVRVADIGGRPAAAVPLSVFRPDVPPEGLVTLLIHGAFHAFLAGSRLVRPDLGVINQYPELSPVNNALGNLEGRILHRFLATATGAAEPPADALETAYDFCLIRRERRGPLDDVVIEYERNLEGSEGLARYVQTRALLSAAAGSPGGPPGPGYVAGNAFQTLAGRDRYTAAPRLWAAQLDKVHDLCVNAAGASWWRFFHSGMALALFADHLTSDWKAEVAAGQSLDEVLERRVSFEGDPADEKRLDALKEQLDFDQRLEEERRFSRLERERKQELLSRILAARGRRVTFDVSALVPDETWWESGHLDVVWDPDTVESVTRDVRIHHQGLRFSGFGAHLEFTGVPVIEDLRHRLLHVNVPVGRLNLEGDGRRFALVRGAEFSDGLEVQLPGVRAQARSGYVQETDGTLYIKVTR